MSRHLGKKRRRVRVDALIERDGTRCAWCCRPLVDLPIDYRQDCRDHMTLEHLVPRSLGGSHDLLNLVLACHECNNERGERAIEFRPPWALRLAVD